MRRRHPLALISAGGLLCGLAGCAVVAVTALPPDIGAAALGARAGAVADEVTAGGYLDSGRALVIAHRGASDYRPEATLAAFDLAIQQGADYIEADLVPTRDGVLVARHENELSVTTDVASHPEFAVLRRTKRVGGQQVTGWFTEDFTLAQLKTLRSVERAPAVRSTSAGYDGLFTVPTLQEIIDLARIDGEKYHRRVGLYLETKLPAYFAAIHLPLEPPLIDALRHNHLDRSDSPVFLESFDPKSLKLLHGQVAVPLIQLIAADPAVTAPPAATARPTHPAGPTGSAAPATPSGSAAAPGQTGSARPAGSARRPARPTRPGRRSPARCRPIRRRAPPIRR